MRSDPQLPFSPDFDAPGLGLPGRHFEDGVSQSGHERNHLFLNLDGRAFADVSGLSGLDSPADGRAFALLDYDRDGYLDIAAVNANAPLLEIFRNRMGDGESRNTFVALDLRGGNAKAESEAGLSNRSAVGARIELDIGSRTLARDMPAGTGHAAQNGRRLLVGVGRAAVIDELRVHWPSGKVTRAQGVPTGRAYVLYEVPRDGVAMASSPYWPAPTRARLDRALERALGYFERLDAPDPSWQGIFGYLHRRFGLAVRLATGDPIHEAALPAPKQSPGARLMARMDDLAVPTDGAAIAAIPSQIDKMTATALHCDRLVLPENWFEVLEAAGRAGGYALTHAVLASQWSVENGCATADAVQDLQGRLAAQLVSLIEGRAALAEQIAAISDVWMEGAALLPYVGQRDLLDPAWLAEALDAQQADGGWAAHPRQSTSDPHASAVALWLLMEGLHPDMAPSRWLPVGKMPLPDGTPRS